MEVLKTRRKLIQFWTMQAPNKLHVLTKAFSVTLHETIEHKHTISGTTQLYLVDQLGGHHLQPRV